MMMVPGVDQVSHGTPKLLPGAESVKADVAGDPRLAAKPAVAPSLAAAPSLRGGADPAGDHDDGGRRLASR